MNKIKIEYSYFDGCPNHKKLWENLKAATKGMDDKIEIVKILVNDIETARRINFRGSPTLLIENEDIEMAPAQEFASLSCRYYPNGVPSVELIKNKILLEIENRRF